MATITQLAIRTLFLFILLLGGGAVQAQPSWRWAISDGTSQGDDYNLKVTVAPNEQVITLGRRGYPVTIPGVFFPATLTVQATDSLGVVQWSREFGAAGSVECEPENVSCDAAGNVYVIFNFGGTLNLGVAGTFTSTSPAVRARDGLLLKLDASGNLLWARQLAGHPNQIQENVNLFALTTDLSGEVWVGGEFYRELTCGPFILTRPSGGSYSGFVMKYSSNGQELELLAVESQNISSVTRLKTDRRGFVYMAGFIERQTTIGSLVLQPQGRDFYVAKLSPQMQPLWARLSGNRHFVQCRDLALTADGGYVVSGYMQDTARFGTSTFYTPTANRWDVFVVRYDSLGQVQWAQRGTGIGAKSMIGLAVDASNNIYAAGAYSSPLTIGGVILPTTPDSANGYVIRYTMQGNTAWVVPIDGVRDNFPRDMALGAGRALYVAGGYDGMMSFGSFNLSSTGYLDSFLARLDGAGPLSNPREKVAASWSLYPNPATEGERVRLELAKSGTGPGLVQVLDARGRVVHEAALAAGEQGAWLSPQGWSRGLYLVRLSRGGEAVGRTLVVR